MKQPLLTSFDCYRCECTHHHRDRQLVTHFTNPHFNRRTSAWRRWITRHHSSTLCRKCRSRDPGNLGRWHLLLVSYRARGNFLCPYWIDSLKVIVSVRETKWIPKVSPTNDENRYSMSMKFAVMKLRLNEGVTLDMLPVYGTQFRQVVSQVEGLNLKKMP